MNIRIYMVYLHACFSLLQWMIMLSLVMNHHRKTPVNNSKNRTIGMTAWCWRKSDQSLVWRFILKNKQACFFFRFYLLIYKMWAFNASGLPIQVHRWFSVLHSFHHYLSFQYDRSVITKGSVQWCTIQSWAEFCLQQDLNPGPHDQKSEPLTT